MYKIIYSILFISVLTSCGNKGKPGDKRAELDSLKNVQTDVGKKIAALEKSLAENDTNAAMKSKIVAITAMKPQSFRHYIEVQAKVEGDRDVMVSAEAMGTVTSLKVQTGDFVTAGEVLATIDDKVVQQSMAEVQSQLALATQLFEKQQHLWQQKIGSEVQFLQAKTNKEALEKRMGSMNEQLQMTRIKAPIAGNIDDVRIKLGQMASPGLPAFRVVNLTSLKIHAELAESYINKVNKGNTAIVYFPDVGKEIPGTIDYSGNRIDPVNRTFNVELHVQATDFKLNPNMIAILKIVDYSSDSTFVLPLGAVQKSSDGEYVFVANDKGGKKTAVRKIVKSGMTYNGSIEVVSGLVPGDKVVTVGYQNLSDGDPIIY